MLSVDFGYVSKLNHEWSKKIYINKNKLLNKHIYIYIYILYEISN
jgi:hypothetical protein